MAHNNFELKVEVVRLNEKDVIATSSRPVDSDAYVVLKSEFNEYASVQNGAKAINNSYNDDDLFYIQYYYEDGIWDAEHIAGTYELGDYSYAWYNKGWYTEGKYASEYDNNYPRGN